MESRERTVKIRRNSHYGYSPIACLTLKTVSRATGEKNSLLFLCKFLTPELSGVFLEVFMKKVVTVLLCVVLACTLFVGCGGKNTVLKETDEFIVLTPSDGFAGKKLSEFMDFAKENGELDYKLENSMVTSVNGIDNPADYSYCWMLYTDDAENSNSAWGTIEYEGKTYASAALGATELVIAENCTYIWVYTEF